MKLLGFDRVLCLSPHPDDVEYSLSGTVMKYQDTHFDLLTMSVGGDFEGSDGHVRINEVKNSWNVTNVNNVSIIIDGKLKPKNNSQDELIYEIESKYFKEYHDAIFIPTYIDSHFEHRLVHELAAPLTRCKGVSVIEYRTPSTLNEWSPNMYIDITDQFNDKINMLSKFDSQKSKWYFKTQLIEHFHADYQSYKKGYKYVEQFKIKQLYKI